MRYTVVALYDEHGTAEQVYRELKSIGIDGGDLHMVSHELTDLSSWDSGRTYWDHGHFGHDIADQLVSLSLNKQDAELYSEGVRRGGTLIVAEVDGSRVDRAADVMNTHIPVDLGARSEGWRKRGFSSYDRTTTPLTREEVELEREHNRDERVRTPVVEDRVVRIGRAEYL